MKVFCPKSWEIFTKPFAFFSLLYYSPSFLVLLAFLYYMDRQNLVPMGMLACLCHEWGHYVCIHCCGGEVRRISFTLVGAEMELPQRFSYGQEFCCALAGPLVNLLLALLFCHWNPVFSGINLALAVLNLLPLSKLDGGRALTALLGCFLPLSWQIGFSKACDFLCTLLILALGVWLFLLGGSVTLLILGIWLMFSWVQSL